MRIARPLPECRTCEQPTKRATWLANGGLCSECLELLASTVRMPRLPPSPDELLGDHTVIVEGYRPPVPGQLALPAPPELESVTCADLLTPCTHAGPHVPVGLDGRPQ